MTDTRLVRAPGPVNIEWRHWRTPGKPDERKPVLRVSRGSTHVTIGPDDVDNLVDALERMADAWEDNE
ncbi:hypothetical protein [Brachybacterium alimentarium]|uniref:hypothetical protein n=1 Tax=Brachybacterium alimentarium TaxID=47845 RepID=UPI003FD615F9